ncbi:MAG: HDOD domain-containing protein [Tepidisphaeraceae bacterium]|jgi:HD-like signal output (HDOD) protein
MAKGTILHDMTTATAPDPKAIVRDAVNDVMALATLPEVTSQVIATVEDPRSSASQLHQIIAHDPSLSARILKVVNSAFYGMSGQVGSVERAIVLLGLNAVKNVVVAASLGQLFRGVRLGEGFTARDLWTHCIAVGVTARELALKVNRVNADEIFVAGLIHDVGILVELQTWPEKLQTICTTAKKTSADFCEVERRVLGVDHQALGKGLAERWRFTKPCQQVAGFHHDPAALADDERTMVTLVYIADTLCCQSDRGFNLTARGQTIDADKLSCVGINDATLEQVRNSMPENIASAMSVFA